MTPRVARSVLGLGPIGAVSSHPAFLAIGLAAATFGFLPAAPALRALIVVGLVLLCETAYRAMPVEGRASSRLVLDRWIGVWAALLVVPDVLGAILAVAAIHGAAAAWPPPPLRRLAAAVGARRSVDDLLVAAIVGPAVRVAFDLLH